MKIILDTKEDFKDIKKITAFLQSLTEENVMSNYPQQSSEQLNTQPIVNDMFSMFGSSEPVKTKQESSQELLNDLEKTEKDDDELNGVQILEY